MEEISKGLMVEVMCDLNRDKNLDGFSWSTDIIFGKTDTNEKYGTRRKEPLKRGTYLVARYDYSVDLNNSALVRLCEHSLSVEEEYTMLNTDKELIVLVALEVF